jgi:hypothetical protein
MVINTNICPAYNTLKQQAHHSPAFVKHVATVSAPLVDEIYKQSNITVAPDDYDSFMDCLNCHMCHGFEIPITRDLAARIEADLTWQKHYEYTYPDRFTNSRIGIGFLIRDMFTWFERRVSGTTDKEFVLYGGHDTTIMPFLAAFGVWNGTFWAPYADHVTMELYKVQNSPTAYPSGWAVRFIHRAIELRLPGCSAVLCDWKQFSAILASLVPVNEKVTCAAAGSFKPTKSSKVMFPRRSK